MSNYDEDSTDQMSDDERLAIRDELKNLSFEELLKLKEKVGLKDYSQTIFSTNDSDDLKGRRKRKKSFKRSNKNQPREESSKIPNKLATVKKTEKSSFQVRDPRFESFCGEYNETAFLKNYTFVGDIQSKEINYLNNSLKKQSNLEKRKQTVEALNKLRNQVKSRERKLTKIEEKSEEKRRNNELHKEGKRPHFKKKGERKAIELIDKFEKLKDSGRLEHYVKKKSKGLSKRPTRMGV